MHIDTIQMMDWIYMYDYILAATATANGAVITIDCLT